jgi:hypothetical protein
MKGRRMLTTDEGFVSRIVRDEDSCRAVARDYGGYLHHVPQVLNPGQSI